MCCQDVLSSLYSGDALTAARSIDSLDSAHRSQTQRSEISVCGYLNGNLCDLAEQRKEWSPGGTLWRAYSGFDILRISTRREYRYPFLDRDLVEFMFAIPRHQILRPGERRSLMRRSLSSVLPPEILKRTRKAYQLRTPILAVRDAKDTLQTLLAKPMLSEICPVDADPLLHVIGAITTDGNTLWWPFVMRAIWYEIWLKSNFGRITISRSHV